MASRAIEMLSPTISQSSTQARAPSPYEQPRRPSSDQEHLYSQHSQSRAYSYNPSYDTTRTPPAVRSPPPGPASPDRPPAPLACTECRRKHVRCDATVPICRRCSTTAGTTCRYLPSRRGLRRRTVRNEASMGGTTAATTTSMTDNDDDLDTVAAAASMASMASMNNSMASIASMASMATMANVPLALPSPQPLALATTTIRVDDMADDSINNTDFVDDDALVNLYYSNFHAAHPILVPRGYYSSQRYPTYLRLVVHCIGSHFSATGQQSDALRDASVKALEAAVAASSVGGRQKSYHIAQARLLLSIALHARGEIRESVSQLAHAVSTALEIGMHRRTYSTTYGGRSPIVEESLRRTWWELYVVDGFVAALQRSTSARSHTCEPDILLPCDEALYGGGEDNQSSDSFSLREHNSPTLEQFDARLYADEPSAAFSFSSFCYRIDAVRILVRALAVSSGAHATHDVQEEQVQAIDNALAAWRHSEASACPPNDEMLFQAHMLIHYTAIYLHFWRSDLASTVPAAFDIIRERHLPPVATPRQTHARMAVTASRQLVDLAARAATPAAVQRHTPFFVFALVFSAIVQLSACALHGPAQHAALYRDRLALISGVLTTLSPVWAFAHSVGRKFRRMTADLLRLRGYSATTVTQTNVPTHTNQHAHVEPTANKTVYMDDSSMDAGFADGVSLYGNSSFPWMDLLTWDPEQL
ncbi:hypothetical protein Sste5346_007623 [Sporothrix stenoceras]|uniref:Zn(2)-C6 fungal-type domain-containing protein n=1 Tax=Sporothrix stenoceras TaxID=5173 RepID=A0ABR3YT54_9PEZI